jgi:hypothetical protein
MAKLTLNTIGSRYGSIDALNDNFDIIEQAFENTLSRDGTGPNTLEATLDANSQRIVNLPDPVNNTEPATKGWVLAQPNQAASSASAAAASAAAAAVSEVNAEAAAEQVVDWEWKDEWATGVLYKVNNIVAIPSGTYEGWSFVCIVDHTSGATFSDDFSAGKWSILAKRGSAGAGTGDMLAANNLSELTNYTAARTNLGLIIGTNVPSPTGTGASGTWNISISGNAATATSASNAVSIAQGATGFERIVGKAAKRIADFPAITVSASDTYRAEAGSNYAIVTPSTTSTANPPTVVAVRYTIAQYTGSMRFKVRHGISDGFTSRLNLYKNGTLVQAYTTTTSADRTNDVSIVPGDVIEWRHSTSNATASSVVSTSTLFSYAPSVSASDAYTTIPLYIPQSQI